MECEVSLRNHVNENVTTAKLRYEKVERCPICKSAISPVFMLASLNTKETASVFDYCPSCKETFITQYTVENVSANKNTKTNVYKTKELSYCEPNRFVKETFDPEIMNLSPTFVEIYNQALQAESLQLNQIAGMGYRKALEFLVKDYAIRNHHDAELDIKKSWLGECILKYIENDKIRGLAQKSVWLGNDETHYVRIHEDRDIKDLQKFIKTIVYYIEMEMTVEDAESIRN